MSDSEAYALFRRLRWADGIPVCPECGTVGAWEIAAKQKLADGNTGSRPLFKCKAKECRRQFSVTSGTTFHSRKLSIRDHLVAIFEFARGAKGHAALQLSLKLCISPRAAFVLLHKLRDAMGVDLDYDTPLGGSVELDLGFFGGRKRKKRERRKGDGSRVRDKRSRAVLTVRERRGRTLVFPVTHESDAADTAFGYIRTGSRIFVDGQFSWNALEGRGTVFEIVHDREFARWEKVEIDGRLVEVAVNTNLAESYFSRMRRAEFGVHHRIAGDKKNPGKYLMAYAKEMAWRETHRRRTCREQFEGIIGAALHQPVSRTWKGYWHRSKEVA